MKLNLRLEYKTQWGETLVLRYGKKRIPLTYTDNGIWKVVIDGFDPRKTPEYGYEVEKDGKCIRKEWKSHKICLPQDAAFKTMMIYDRWIDIPSDAPLHTSAFTDGIFGREKQHIAPARKASKSDKVCKGDKVCKSDKGNVCNVSVTAQMADIRPDEVLAIAGSCKELGEWKKAVAMDGNDFPLWKANLELTGETEYKFVIADKETLTPKFWEYGDNRRIDTQNTDNELLIISCGAPRIASRKFKGIGTAIPVFSLRSEDGFGTGEFLDLKKIADWAAETGQCIIQLLPINDTTMTDTWQDSYPYNANSTFALHPQFINLPAAGVPQDEEYEVLRKELNALPQMDYERVNNEKTRLLRKAFDMSGKKTLASAGFKKFMESNEYWLIPYAAFRTLRDEYGTAEFKTWGDYSKYDSKAIGEYCKSHKKDIDFHCFTQYHLHIQLTEACEYAHSRGVVLKGDLPIGISRTSVDAWLHPELFHMDSQAGAPPDAFSVLGQNWGFPTYNWDRMAKDDFAWWKQRLEKMSEYFDAFRIDHILGFFRIWEIPTDALHGLLGHFNPALPYSSDELLHLGFDLSSGHYVSPIISEEILNGVFGEFAEEVGKKYIKDGKLSGAYSTQRKIAAKLSGEGEKEKTIREGLMSLLDDVLFVEDPYRKGYWHPRIAAHSTNNYRQLDCYRRSSFDKLYDDFFYRRHNQFWKESAMRKLPDLLSSTRMLACGEDLGMIPDCVPDVMRDLRILSLEIQRMPKSPSETFANPASYPYFSVCTTSTHDMNPLRAWWEEDRKTTEMFFSQMLGGSCNAPQSCEPWICERIIRQHIASPAMFTILPLQDWMSMDENLRCVDPQSERINVPAIPRYYWRYRMNVTIERLLSDKEFNDKVTGIIKESGQA